MQVSLQRAGCPAICGSPAMFGPVMTLGTSIFLRKSDIERHIRLFPQHFDLMFMLAIE